MDIEAFLREARKAQLQEYYLRWFPGEEMVGLREKLMERLGAAMRDPQKVRSRFDRLARSAQDFLGALLGREEYEGTLEQIRSERRSRSIEDFELEGLIRNLLDEGLITSENQPGSDGGWREVFRIPLEIGNALRRTVDLEEREVAKMLSLRDVLHDGEVETIDRLARPESVEARIGELSDPQLRSLVLQALGDHGGILTASRVASREAGSLPLHRQQWREALERLRLGTTGVISLRDFGIDLEEEGLLIFQELILQRALERARGEPPECDRELSLGVDLLVDLDRILEIVHMEQVEVTREGAVFKKIEDRIGPKLITPACAEVFNGEAVQFLFGLCRRLNFFDLDGARLRCDPIRRRAWASKRPLAKIREIFTLLQLESRSDRWSFHQSALRELFTATLTALPAGKWVDARALFSAAVASYLLSLKERGVDAEFRRRANEEFHHEKLTVPLEKLHHDLSYWVLHRLGLLGLVDLGYRGRTLEALRLSPLGVQFFNLQAAVSSPPEPTGGAAMAPPLGPPRGAVEALPKGESEGTKAPEGAKMIVNPDFEVLIFPGGERQAELILTLSHFADCVVSEKVKRYQVNAESVKRGVIAGMDVGAILSFLETNGSGPLPPNVRYSIREWGEGVEPIQRQRVLLLRARSRAGAERLAALLEAHDVPCERLGECGLLVQAGRAERALRGLRDALRDQGLYLE